MQCSRDHHHQKPESAPASWKFDNCMIFWKDDDKLQECRFSGSRDINQLLEGPVSHTNVCGTCQSLIDWNGYTNQKGHRRQWDGMHNIQQRMGRLGIRQMQRRGNTFRRYILTLLTSVEMSILAYALMVLAHLVCLGDNILYGLSFWRHTIFHRKCACKENSCLWVF